MTEWGNRTAFPLKVAVEEAAADHCERNDHGDDEHGRRDM
jgi:hypothetical protein